MADCIASTEDENTWQGEGDTFLQAEKAAPGKFMNLIDSDASRFVPAKLATGVSVRHTCNASNRDDLTGRPQQPDQSKSFISILLRTLSLQSFRSAFLAENEASKIALRKSRATALLRGTVHLIPVSVAITVIVLNSVGVYVGGNASWLPSLQFLAKLQEMLMQASIARRWCLHTSATSSSVMTCLLGYSFPPCRLRH